MKKLPLLLILTLLGCAHPSEISTSLSIQKKEAGLILVTIRVTNLADRATTPLSVELSGESRTNGQWSKHAVLLHPAAFVLNRKEQRDITKIWRVPADTVRTTVVIKEQETGTLLKTEKAEKTFEETTSPP